MSNTKAFARRWQARYTLVGLMFGAYVLAWSDRIGFSVATPKIMETFGWSKTEMGVVLSAFTWGFVVFKLPAGLLADRYGGLKPLIGAILCWSFVTLLFPLAGTLTAMAALRLLLGMGQITYPPSQIRILSRFFPDQERSKVNGICLTGSDAATIIFAPLAAFIVFSYGWEAVFYLFGMLGIIWGLILWWWSSKPQTENRLAEEANLVNESRGESPPFPWKRLFKIRAVWGLALIYVPLTYCIWVFLHWLPTYLVEARGFTLLQMGFSATLPSLAQGAAQFGAGWLSPYLMAKGFSKDFSRKSIIAGGFLGGAFFILLIESTPSPILALVYISAAMAFLGACYTPIWTLPTDMSSRWPGTIFGFAGMIGFLGSVAAPIVTGYFVDTTGSWRLAFYFAAAISLLGFVATLFLVSSKSVDEQLTA